MPMNNSLLRHYRVHAVYGTQLFLLLIMMIVTANWVA